MGAQGFAAGMQVAGSGLQAYGRGQSTIAARRQGRMEEMGQEVSYRAAMDRDAAEVDAMERQAQAVRLRLRAQYGAGNVIADTGSPLEAQMQVIDESARAASLAQRQRIRREQAYKVGAAMGQFNEQMLDLQRLGGYLGAGFQSAGTMFEWQDRRRRPAGAGSP